LTWTNAVYCVHIPFLFLFTNTHTFNGIQCPSEDYVPEEETGAEAFPVSELAIKKLTNYFEAL